MPEGDAERTDALFHPPVIVRDYGSDLGLLKHDLGDPDLCDRNGDGKPTRPTSDGNYDPLTS